MRILFTLQENIAVRARVIIHTHSSVSISKIFKVRTGEFITALGTAEGAPTAIIDALKAHTEGKKII